MKVNSKYFKKKYTYGNKNRKYTLIILILTMFFMVGYAYLNTLLTINGTIKLNKNTWDVHFENIQKVDGSIDATVDATISNNTTINFTVDLQMPGEFYSFTVDVVNSGTIDAMLSEILKTGLTTEQEVYTEYTVTYNDGEEILAKDSLPSNTKDTLLVTIKYKDDITAEQLPTEDQNINLSLDANYIQDDGTSDNRRPPSLYSMLTLRNLENRKMVLDNTSSKYVTSSTGINFEVASSDTNGKGLYVRAGTENDLYPIYYYRGNVTDNNVIFANYCWKIVRTTETGGIKLIYNGIPTDGKCNNTGLESQIGTSAFNSNYSYNAYVGYMYGTPNSATYEEEHKNTNESVIKKYIDSWYEANMTKYTSFLEDTIWCNDRSVERGTGVGADDTYYNSTIRRVPSLECVNQNDRFTVNEIIEGRIDGNGALTYPVALLTVDEVILAGIIGFGYGDNDYLTSDSTFWLLSPHTSYEGSSSGLYARFGGNYPDSLTSENGVRPSVSLALGTKISGNGDGTANNPYYVNCG